jgi:MerR family transcriptional regulator, mercuric resistance operon regulatory protein
MHRPERIVTGMRIGLLADAAGIPARTIRFYERKGLLPHPERSANGYRVYDETALDGLRFIRSAQAAGLTLSEISTIINVRGGGSAPCAHVGGLLEAKLDDVRQRSRELEALENELADLLDRSQQLDPSDCGDRGICHILDPDSRLHSARPSRPT